MRDMISRIVKDASKKKEESPKDPRSLRQFAKETLSLDSETEDNINLNLKIEEHELNKTRFHSPTASGGMAQSPRRAEPP